MKWYAVHAVMGHFFKIGNRGPILVFENILLVFASDKEQAQAKAEIISRSNEGDCKGSLQINGRSAIAKFVGIRKIVLCDSPEEAPKDGTEVSYLELEFANKRDLNRYIHGNDVLARFVDYFREDKNKRKTQRKKRVARRK